MTLPCIVVIAGGRNQRLSLRDREALLLALTVDTLVLTGGATGVDVDAANVARGMGCTVETVLPDWDQHGKTAGPIRNCEMSRRAAASKGGGRVYLFPGGRGTESMRREAEKAGVPVTDWR